MIVFYIKYADLEAIVTCVRNSLLSWLESFSLSMSLYYRTVYLAIQPLKAANALNKIRCQLNGCTPGARSTKYLTAILRLSYNNSKVTIDLWRTSNLQNILRRTQGFSYVGTTCKIVRLSENSVRKLLSILLWEILARFKWLSQVDLTINLR